MDLSSIRRNTHMLHLSVGPAAGPAVDDAVGPARPDGTRGAAPAAPIVSVIVCTHNRPAGLRRALDSVWRQGMGDLEVIVVDDGSDEPVRLPEPPHGEL